MKAQRLVTLLAVGFAALALGLSLRSQPAPAPPEVRRAQVGLYRTHKVLNDRAHFHEDPWTQVAAPQWKGRYTLAMALPVTNAQKGDLLLVNYRLMITCRRLYDCRVPGKKQPVSCQVSTFVRLLTEIPAETVLDLPPSNTTALGLRQDSLGLFGTSYGPDLFDIATVQDVRTEKPVGVGVAYYADQQTVAVLVERVPVVVGVWVFPESAGCDGDASLGLPATSDYSGLTAVLFRP